MFDIASRYLLVKERVRARWAAIGTEVDKGASTLEYVLLVIIGVVVASLAYVAIRAAVTTQDTGINRHITIP